MTIDGTLHHKGDSLTCLYSTDATQIGAKIVVDERNGMAVYLTVPAAGFVIFS